MKLRIFAAWVLISSFTVSALAWHFASPVFPHFKYGDAWYGFVLTVVANGFLFGLWRVVRFIVTGRDPTSDFGN